ncbi:glycine cleavage system aminomethyltransferase GcvT [uncultured Agrococcus sp.]|uniref:glycine cleavage system aminomethyltransferase GcvT n=1 Tax=uncultured Agrococcus sp. TaxID=382258 RepID=UPI0025EAAA6F|nr:glycine cleavage system aminomethyltransferase GcvT [uncultured Agrococcus sp.]
MKHKTPLASVHERLGATFTDFAGWDMPLKYGSELAEHEAVRTSAGIFDLSHMGEIRVAGADAGAFLDFALAGKLSSISVGRAKYSLMLNDSGGIVDDVIVYRLGETNFLVVANAGNRAAVLDALQTRSSSFDVTVTDESEDTALIAVQGPNSQAIIEAAGIESEPLDSLRYYRVVEAIFEGEDLLIARTGYTGEDGFELYIPAHAAESLWETLERVGEQYGLRPCGLAARDTLRLEAGMPLYGNELTTDRLPEQAGLGKIVALSKDGDFVGRTAVERGPEQDAPVLIGLTAEGRRAGRSGYEVYEGDTLVGVVTSGALSPTLGHPIAMAYVAPASAESSELAIDVRGKRIPAAATNFPFYKRKA